jgi:site-specific DNA-cytosine methylase
MSVLVACEASQVVTLALREAGIEAYSCDILPAEGGHPEWHREGDVLEVGAAGRWDVLLAFPPCTHLTSSGARWWPEKQADGRQQEAIDFVKAIWALPVPRKCLENPVGILSSEWQKPSQVIHPWEYGHPEKKGTCLWLDGLPPLKPTSVVPKEERSDRLTRMGRRHDRAKIKSRTFEGVATAMAIQWRWWLEGKG